jgi:hypothetical protein
MPGREVGARGSASTDILLGELIAETRANKHATNNLVQKVDALSPAVASIKEALNRIEKLEQERIRHDARLSVLEADKLRHEGRISVGEWFARHWPFSFLVAALAALVAWANTWRHP